MDKISQSAPALTSVALRLYTRPELREILHVGDNTFRKLERESLPAPIYVSPGKPCWAESDIQTWLKSRKGETL